ncbi:MAG: spermidine synthase [Acidobacteriota bacterium]|nr:spermidine synthase [Acidobacteriota bacterium]
MTLTPVLSLLAIDFLIFAVALYAGRKAAQRPANLLLFALFFCSGMPALIYQIVWERVLFGIYGVNSESVAVIVSAFMLGLGVGSLLGGKLSARYPRRGIMLFGLAELGTAIFGLISLRIFHWIARFTAGASLPETIALSIVLLGIPTVLMGATLPLLVEHLVQLSGDVGQSVAFLYFVNTLGSAVACALSASYLLREFGQSGSVSLAALLGTVVGGIAFLTARSGEGQPALREPAVPAPSQAEAGMPLSIAMLIAGVSGFIALGFEIAWFRTFSLAASDRAPAFALLLSTYLAGIAAGSFLAQRFLERKGTVAVSRSIGVLMLTAGAGSVFLPPLVAHFMVRRIPFLLSAPAFFLVAALIGSVLPLACQLAVSPDERAGRGVSLVYAANIVGAVAGSLGIGFIWMNYFGLRQISLHLGFAAVIFGAIVLVFASGRAAAPPAWASAAVVAALILVPAASPLYAHLFPRLIFADRPEAAEVPAHIVENRNGVIVVMPDGAVFSGGVYDGYFNTDPNNDVNLLLRIYTLSAYQPNPKHVFELGLSSGSWAQVLANHPQIDSLDIVEINPGYLKLISQYPEVRSLLHNPKVHIYIDDARRWLIAHPDRHYDAIIANGSYYWRDNSCYILSTEFLRLVRQHLNPGGVYLYNTTESLDALATGLHVFPYGLRVLNFLAVSDSPIVLDKARMLKVLNEYKIDGVPAFDPSNPKTRQTLVAYTAFVDSASLAPQFLGMETGESLRARVGKRYIFTDDNMGWEWRSWNAQIPWH